MRPHPSVEAYEKARREQQEKLRRAKRRRGLLVALCLLVAAALALGLVCRLSARPPAAGSAPPPGQSPGTPSVSGGAGASASAAASGSAGEAGPWDEAGVPPLFTPESPIPEGYDPDLVWFRSGGLSAGLNSRAAAAYQAMAAAAEEDGVRLRPLSAYRSAASQAENYEASIQTYLRQGKSRQEAERLTARYYALPGTSEHEAGLAVDIGDGDTPAADIDDSFTYTAAYEWLQRHAPQYGFIQRYHRAAEGVTGIAWEPWHYRYVGANHAAKIEEGRLTLEDYVAGLEA